MPLDAFNLSYAFLLCSASICPVVIAQVMILAPFSCSPSTPQPVTSKVINIVMIRGNGGWICDGHICTDKMHGDEGSCGADRVNDDDGKRVVRVIIMWGRKRFVLKLPMLLSVGDDCIRVVLVLSCFRVSRRETIVGTCVCTADENEHGQWLPGGDGAVRKIRCSGTCGARLVGLTCEQGGASAASLWRD